jgi:hypothetical protein
VLEVLVLVVEGRCDARMVEAWVGGGASKGSADSSLWPNTAGLSGQVPQVSQPLGPRATPAIAGGKNSLPVVNVMS